MGRSRRCYLDESRAPTENCAREIGRSRDWPSRLLLGRSRPLAKRRRRSEALSQDQHQQPESETAGLATAQTIRGIRGACDSRETIVGSTLEFTPVILLFCWLIVDSSLSGMGQTLPQDTYQAILGKITFKDPKIKEIQADSQEIVDLL